MAYATAEDLLGRLDDDQRTQLSSDSTPDPAGVTTKNLNDASDWIDGYLGRFNPPMVVGVNATVKTMDTLRVHCCIVTKHFLFGRKSSGEPFKQQDEDFQATKRYFEGVQGGKALPGATAPAAAKDTTNVTGASVGGDVVFTDDSAVL